MSSLISGGYCDGVPPLPIPNREVKPVCADGTAMQCGRVGSRLFFSGKTPDNSNVSPESFSFRGDGREWERMGEDREVKSGCERIEEDREKMREEKQM